MGSGTSPHVINRATAMPLGLVWAIVVAFLAGQGWLLTKQAGNEKTLALILDRQARIQEDVATLARKADGWVSRDEVDHMFEDLLRLIESLTDRVRRLEVK